MHVHISTLTIVDEYRRIVYTILIGDETLQILRGKVVEKLLVYYTDIDMHVTLTL